jgi:hypothetical protein
MTMNFTDFVAASQNTHLDHLEDLLLDGSDAAAWVLKVLADFGHALTVGERLANMELSTKWDGSPAVVFGPDPADGRFFVGTKSVFAQNAKPAKSHEDVDRFYAGPVATILHAALDRLRHIHPGVVLQGDVLYAHSPVAPAPDSAGYQFRPNTLIYHVPLTHPFADRIRDSHFGLVVHTIYTSTGATLRDLNASPITPKQFATLRQDTGVFLVNPVIDVPPRFTAEQVLDYMLTLERLSETTVPQTTYEVLQQEPLRSLMQRFVNYVVRNSSPLTAEQVTDFIAWKRQQEIAKRKSQSGKEAVATRFVDLSRQLVFADLPTFFKQYRLVQRAKTLILQTLDRASDLPISVATESGPLAAGPEGYVLHAEGRSVKLVERNVFSYYNFKTQR